MRVGEGEGGPNLAEQPRLTRVQPPALPISREVAAGDREGPSADWEPRLPKVPSWPRVLRELRVSQASIWSSG
jgi:hypothetical protein